MMRNAVSKNERELAHIAKEVLDRRFPGWDAVAHKASGARFTTAFYCGIERHFPTSKEAYLWLIERFISAKPELFEKISWETVFVPKGKKRNYFAPALEKLFHGSPHLAEDRNNYAKLTNGWFANTNLDNNRKYEILCRFAGVAKLEHEREWRWDVRDPSKDLMDRKEMKALGSRSPSDFRINELGEGLSSYMTNLLGG